MVEEVHSLCHVATSNRDQRNAWSSNCGKVEADDLLWYLRLVTEHEVIIYLSQRTNGIRVKVGEDCFNRGP
jgi:hypothetical protein